MINGVKIKSHLNISLIGSDHYARQGIASLLLEMDSTIKIKLSVSIPEHLKMIPENKIDMLFFSVNEPHNSGFDCLSHINKIREIYPKLIVCMYATHTNSLLWVRGDIDAYISLQDPIYYWRTSLLKIIDSRYRPNRKPLALSLTPTEWRVLKDLKKGLKMSYIAKIEKLSYRRVSAVKSSAIRKLGLRNKTDLLVFLTSQYAQSESKDPYL